MLCPPGKLCPLGKLCLWGEGPGTSWGTAVCWEQGLFEGGKELPQELLEMLVISRTGTAWGRCWGSCAPCLAQLVLPVLPACPGCSGLASGLCPLSVWGTEQFGVASLPVKQQNPLLSRDQSEGNTQETERGFSGSSQ